MTKDEYIEKLKSGLSWNIQESKMNEIINDYSEYFDAGLSEGSTEDELCVLFGNPVLQAKSIMRELPQYRSILWMRIGYSILLFLLGVLLFKSSNGYDFLGIRSFLLPLFLVLPLLHPFAFTYENHQPKTRLLWILSGMTILSLIAVVLVIWFLWNTSYIAYLVTIIKPTSIGPITELVLWISQGSLLVMIGTIFLIKHKIYYVSFMVANSCLFICGNLLIRLLHGMDDIAILPQALQELGKFVIGTIALAFVVLMIQFGVRCLSKAMSRKRVS